MDWQNITNNTKFILLTLGLLLFFYVVHYFQDILFFVLKFYI